MKNLTIFTVLAAFVLLVGGLNAAFACGTCGCATAREVGRAHAQQHMQKAEGTMPCGCPMTDESMMMHQKMNVLKMAEHAGSFNTLLKAINAAGLEETLMSDGPFTIFAPTDEAFARLPEGTLDNLLKNEDKLRAVLTYHVHPDLAMAADVVKMSSLETVNGQKAAVMVEPCGVMIDHSTLTSTDIQCSNGVIHVIDTVMIPKDETM